MTDTRQITADMKEMAKTFIQNQFGGGNVGAALAGKYIADSNLQVAASIDRLASAVEKLAGQPTELKLPIEFAELLVKLATTQTVPPVVIRNGKKK